MYRNVHHKTDLFLNEQKVKKYQYPVYFSIKNANLNCTHVKNKLKDLIPFKTVSTWKIIFSWPSYSKSVAGVRQWGSVDPGKEAVRYCLAVLVPRRAILFPALMLISGVAVYQQEDQINKIEVRRSVHKPYKKGQTIKSQHKKTKQTNITIGNFFVCLTIIYKMKDLKLILRFSQNRTVLNCIKKAEFAWMDALNSIQR